MTDAVYVPSRGRALTSATLRSLDEERIPARVFVPVQEVSVYAAAFPHLDIVWSDAQRRGIGAVRQSMLRHARAHGHQWMWMLDDDISEVYVGSERSTFGAALQALEDERAHWPNVALFGPMIHQWARLHGRDSRNCSIQSFFSLWTVEPWEFWPHYLEDVDLAMQVLTAGCGVVKTAKASFVASVGGMGSREGGCFDGYKAGQGSEAVKMIVEKWGSDLTVGKKVWPNGTQSVRPRRAAFALPERRP